MGCVSRKEPSNVGHRIRKALLNEISESRKVTYDEPGSVHSG